MNSHSTVSASEMVLSVVAVRLAGLVLVGLTLLALPAHPGDRQLACSRAALSDDPPRARPAAEGRRVEDETLRDMLLHD